MMKPKRTIATRYRREEEQASTSGDGIHNPIYQGRSRVSSDTNKNKNPAPEVPDFVDYKTYKMALDNIESVKYNFQKDIFEQRKKMTSLLKLKDTEITDLKQTVEVLDKNLNEFEEYNKELIEVSKTSEKENKSLKKEKQNLKKKITSLQSDIRKLKVQKEKNGKLLQKARQSCKEVFDSRIHPNFVGAHSNMITEVVKLYESCRQGDKIQHCPVIQFINSVPEPITSPWVIEDIASNTGPPSKKRKINDSINGIDKHYSENSLKELVMDLEPRHSDEYELWRNVLWALNQYGLERGYNTLKIADSFSKRSSKYKNLQDVKTTFESSDGSLSLQYLVETSKIYEEGLEAMTKYLNTILPAKYTLLTINQVDIRDRQQFRINVNSAVDDESHTLLIIPDLFIVGNEDSKRICFLENTIKSKKSNLVSLCPEMEKGFIMILKKEHYEFQARNDSSVSMTLLRPLKPAESCIILPSGKSVNKEFHLTEIRKAIRAEAIKLLSKRSGKKFGDDKDDTNMFIIPDEDSDRVRSDAELVDALIDADPDMMSRYFLSGKTIFHCKPSTNLWCTLTEMELDSHLRKNLKATLKLNKKELKCISMSKAFVRIRNLTLSKIENAQFPGLDSNLHLFITMNKTIVTSSIPPIMAETTCGWSYSYELSMKHMESVQSYFDRLIPRQREREWFLSFVARMLNGQRRNDFFLVLTDKSEDIKNGISTLMSLLATVFGNYFIANTKIVVAGGMRDSNQYDGGIYNLKGKRLLVADKLQKTDTLNRDLIKFITSQSNYCMQYKKKFSPNRITFPVQAGLIMTFSEDNVPKFDKNDQNFVNAMVAIPMRSRFLSTPEIRQLTQNKENLTDIHVADDSLKLKFPEWSSAVLDLLIKYYNEPLTPIPDSMVGWTKRLCMANYDYYDWLGSHIERVDNNREFVTAKDIMTVITKSPENHHPREMEKLKLAMSAWAEKNDFHYKGRHAYMVSNRKRVEAKSAMMGSRLHDIDDDEE